MPGRPGRVWGGSTEDEDPSSGSDFDQIVGNKRVRARSTSHGKKARKRKGGK
jgi:hypothetical protein